MLKTNRDSVVAMAVEGKAKFPIARNWMVNIDGTNNMGIGCAGIHYNVKVGDRVCQFVGDHVEPGVTLIAGDAGSPGNPANLACYTFGCVGNAARIVSGDAKGARGTVTGHHGGGNHTIVDFPQSALEKLTYEDRILIRGFGQGLKLLDYPAICTYALDPDLLNKMRIKETKKGLDVPVVQCIPAQLMGSGLGHIDSFRGDYDIQTGDPEMNKRIGLERLRLGDFVALLDQDGTFGYSFRQGAVSIGVIIHADSPVAGHGPGVQVLLTTRESGLIRLAISANANLGRYLGIGRWRK
jgi:hypothetical protein